MADEQKLNLLYPAPTTEVSEAKLAQPTAEEVLRVQLWLNQQRHRSSLALDFAGWWTADSDQALWELGYHKGNEHWNFAPASKRSLIDFWFPKLFREGNFIYIKRAGAGPEKWIEVLPGAY